MSTVISILLSVIAAVLYHLGGLGKDGSFWGIRGNRYYRRLGMPAIVLLTLVTLRHSLPWWVYLSVFVLQFGAVSTYFKWGGQENVTWYNWLLVGLFNGLVVFLVGLVMGSLTWVILRTLFLMISITAISELSKSNKVEELGRGGLINLSLLFIHLASAN